VHGLCQGEEQEAGVLLRRRWENEWRDDDKVREDDDDDDDDEMRECILLMEMLETFWCGSGSLCDGVQG